MRVVIEEYATAHNFVEHMVGTMISMEDFEESDHFGILARIMSLLSQNEDIAIRFEED